MSQVVWMIWCQMEESFFGKHLRRSFFLCWSGQSQVSHSNSTKHLSLQQDVLFNSFFFCWPILLFLYGDSTVAYYFFFSEMLRTICCKVCAFLVFFRWWFKSISIARNAKMRHSKKKLVDATAFAWRQEWKGKRRREGGCEKKKKKQKTKHIILKKGQSNVCCKFRKSTEWNNGDVHGASAALRLRRCHARNDSRACWLSWKYYCIQLRHSITHSGTPI